MMLCRRVEVAADRGASSAATSRARAGRTTGATGAVCGIPLPAGLRESDRLPEPLFTPVDEGARPATTRTSRSTEVAELVGARHAERLRATVAIALYAFAASRSPSSAGIILADTKFEFGIAARRRAAPHRRGHDARLVALLGRRRRTSPAGPRRASTSSSSATGSRPSRGTRRRPGRRCRPTSSHGTRQRYVEAFERITGASFARYLEEDVIAR